MKQSRIVKHCITATTQKAKIESIQRYWKEKLKWKSPGYHFIIKPDGTPVPLQPIELPSNGVAGFNKNAIHISYIGGVDAKGNAIDNRTGLQKKTQVDLLRELHKKFPDAKICGHRDFPGVHKMCPSFEVSEWLKTVDIKS